MSVTKNKNLTKNSRELRKNSTAEERKLWYTFLKTLPVTINRQKVIGNYIVDFYCASKKIAIEIDGSQHYEDEHELKDKERDKTLGGLGITVLRYSNHAINTEFENVCKDILKYMNMI